MSSGARDPLPGEQNSFELLLQLIPQFMHNALIVNDYAAYTESR